MREITEAMVAAALDAWFEPLAEGWRSLPDPDALRRDMRAALEAAAARASGSFW